MQHVFVNPAGQDDNLGDSALRVGLLRALAGLNVKLHVHLENQSSDYLSGIPIAPRDAFYESRREWLRQTRVATRPVFVMNAGEINPPPDRGYPAPGRAAEMRSIVDQGGVVIVTGIGLKDPAIAGRVKFDATLRSASIVSWRDHGSRDAVGFGEVAPDWAFALGSAVSDWSPPAARPELAVTLRFDRPWPDAAWFNAVRALASRTGTRIVTLAQVARDAPRAARLAQALGGEYLIAPSNRHDDLDSHVRTTYSRCLAVVSDRAHALIMGATEGAYPVGTATDPQKIRRLLDTAGIGELTGAHETLSSRVERLEPVLPGLPLAIESARDALTMLGGRIREVIHTEGLEPAVI